MPSPSVEQIRADWLILLPDPEERRMVAGIMADTIIRAHAENPSSWMISYQPKQRRVNINVGAPS